MFDFLTAAWIPANWVIRHPALLKFLIPDSDAIMTLRRHFFLKSIPGQLVNLSTADVLLCLV